MVTKYLDANTILRLIIKDNIQQFELILGLINQAGNKKIKLFASVISVFESEWVLRSFYKFEKLDIIDLLLKVLSIREINFENSDILYSALENMKINNLGLEDNYHIAYCILNNFEFETFDQKANKIFKELKNIK